MKKLSTYIPYVVIAILIIMYVSKCTSVQTEIDKANEDWKFKELMYTNNKATLTQTIDDQGVQITMQESLIVTKDQEKEMLLIENTRLKNVKSQVKIVTKVVIKEVYIPFETRIYDTILGDSANPFNKVDKWYSISGISHSKGIRVDSLTFKNKLQITIGEKSNGLFKKNTPFTEVVNDNPYSSVTEMYNVNIEPAPKKFYQKTAFKVGIGVIVGLAIPLL